MRDAQDTKRQTVGGTTMFHGEPGREPFTVNENDTVDRFFPKPVRLTLPDHTTRVFPAGLQPVPRDLADHQWLKDNGVVELRSGASLPPMMRSATPGSQAFAQTAAPGQSAMSPGQMNPGVYDATMIPNYATQDVHVQQAEAVARMAADNAAALREQLEEAERIAASAASALEDVRRRAADNRSGTEAEVKEDPRPGAGSGTKQETDAEREKREDNEKAAKKAAADAERLARYNKLTDKMKEDYAELETDEERDEFLTEKGR